MHVMSKLRRALARHPSLYWITSALIAALLAVVVARRVDALDDARRSWGGTRRVAVARDDVAPGAMLAPSIEWRDLPVGAIPASAATVVPDDVLARQHIAAGEIVVAVDLARGDAPLALLPDGWLAIDLAGAWTTSPWKPGDRAVLLAGDQIVAAEALILQARGDGLVVAVPAADAPRAAAMAADRLLIVAVSG